jgi:two-component system chemotaxis response regulator CheY
MSVVYDMPVLVVDDVPAMQEIIGAVARRAGFSDIENVASGGAALERLRKKKFGLVISDVEMDEMSGLDLLEHVRADDRMKQTRFIMISAHRRSEFVKEAVERGVDCFMVKPFSPRQLQNKIEWVCAQRARSPGHR